ncbi:MAG: ATP-dependent Clp protease adaptor ClpS [Anaerolineales bacterium]|nr:ATP-dependent Clp protease adaptor ClpS [Anaerolineales bacterium]
MLLQTDVEEAIEQDLGLSDTDAANGSWKVVIHNDDVTPYDFVIMILQTIFQLSPVAAELVTYIAHSMGLALVAVLPQKEAQRRVGKAHFAAQLEGYPLTFSLESDDN